MLVSIVFKEYLYPDPFFVIPALWFLVFPEIIFMMAWIWGISLRIENNIPSRSSLNILIFKIAFFIPIINILADLTYTWYNFFIRKILSASLVSVMLLYFHALSILCVLFVMGYAAKILKSAQLNKEVSFLDYASEFILIILSPIGIWVLQPRLNRIAKKVAV